MQNLVQQTHDTHLVLNFGIPDIEVNRQDTLGYTALSLAAVNGFHSVVELLLKHPDIELDIKEFKKWRSALVLAAERDDEQTVRMLLQRGADWQMKDHQGGTAALRAVDYAHSHWTL